VEEVKVKSRGRDESAGHVQWNARFARRLQPPSRSSSVALLLCEAYTSISSEDVSGIHSVDRLSL
jgi:hypothetical protein